MTIALDSNSRIPPSVFSPSYCSVLKTTAILPVVRRETVIGDAAAAAAAEEVDRCSSSSSSSIGVISDFSVRSSDDEDGDDNEAESSFKGSLGMESLEEVLPMRLVIVFCSLFFTIFLFIVSKVRAN